MPTALEQLLSETAIGKRQTFNHAPQQSAYQQFQQEYPGIDNYGRKVASGDMFKENMQRLSSDMENTQELAYGRGDPEKGNIMDYLGFAGMTKPTDEIINAVKSIKGEPVREINRIRGEVKPSLETVYHSTKSDFNEFDQSRGIGGQTWFTSRKDLAEKGYDGAEGSGRIVKANIDIRNPAGWEEYDKYSLDELMGQGYDGLKLVDDDQVTYATFFPEQIKLKYNKSTAKDDLMKQLQPENLPAMLRKQAGFDTDPNFKPTQFKPDDFSMEMIERMEIARSRKK